MEALKFFFTHASGETEPFGIVVSACSNPLCACTVAGLAVHSLDADDTLGDLRYSFGFDVAEGELGDDAKTSAESRVFAEAFLAQLTDREAEALYEMWSEDKVRITEETPDEEFDVAFPFADIEKNGTLVSFHEYLPGAEPVGVEMDGELYFIDNLFCVAPDCDCADTFVTVIPTEAPDFDPSNPPLPPGFWIDYRTGRRGEIDPQFLGRAKLERIGALLSERSYLERFGVRHARLKRLYLAQRSKHNWTPSAPASSDKIGRNDPCPCGSGKKYKRCCLGT